MILKIARGVAAWVDTLKQEVHSAKENADELHFHARGHRKLSASKPVPPPYTPEEVRGLFQQLKGSLDLMGESLSEIDADACAAVRRITSDSYGPAPDCPAESALRAALAALARMEPAAPATPERPAPVDFLRVRADALKHVDAVMRAWLPNGRREGADWVTRDPTRADAKHGGFSVNTYTGEWSDLDTGHKGADLVSLVAYLDRAPDLLTAARALSVFCRSPGIASPSVAPPAGLSVPPATPTRRRKRLPAESKPEASE
ncbi:MAG: hypothetical protein MUE46_05875 [Xanthomonadales bacterium]|nr:hypothetical protein [Xanthomonadales bacterium]